VNYTGTSAVVASAAIAASMASRAEIHIGSLGATKPCNGTISNEEPGTSVP